MKTKILTLLLAHLILTQQTTQNSCQLIQQQQLCQKCLNNICEVCIDPQKSPQTDCKCQLNQFYNKKAKKCQNCHSSCKSCSGPKSDQCLSCENLQGISLNYVTGQCFCQEGYIEKNGNLKTQQKNRCKKVYQNGKNYVEKCPDNMEKQNKKKVLKNIPETQHTEQQSNEKLRSQNQDEKDTLKQQQLQKIPIENECEEIRQKQEKQALQEKRRIENLAQEKRKTIESIKSLRQMRKLERQNQKYQKIAENLQKLKNVREIRQEKNQTLQNLQKTCQKSCKNLQQLENSQKNNFQLQKSQKLELEKISAKKAEIQAKQAAFSAAKKTVNNQLQEINLDSALKAVSEISQSDVVFMQNLKQPPERIVMTLEACMMAIKRQAKKYTWDELKREMMDVTFRKKLLQYNPESLPDKVARKITKDYIESSIWNLQRIKKASAVSGAFALWLNAIIKFKKIKFENKELFEQIQFVKNQELEIQKDIKQLEEYETYQNLLHKEERQIDKENKLIENQIIKLKYEISQNNEEQIKIKDEIEKLNTNDIQISEIQEQDEEQYEDEIEKIEINSDIDLESLKTIQIKYLNLQSFM
ncbi:Insulin-like growth factor binding protein, N-terminal [Pseudocohnilembus persalinus]|uniref:Insulin-like growth factor binding protein, N-terminal n=1 Tax=Pseudocohnilembus persalinus TaxID=266149 RepID=A0A0V0QMR1_PSEPJ|nr:Insulin-like growth factor binding protein, N-terminal [Pseudocohnilembus persalinus]|eukprot:KRX03420.1 Insulin-like growth factor binding protein, N-terminal [Pseudocohnilembus persalinus]